MLVIHSSPHVRLLDFGRCYHDKILLTTILLGVMGLSIGYKITRKEVYERDIQRGFIPSLNSSFAEISGDLWERRVISSCLFTIIT